MDIKMPMMNLPVTPLQLDSSTAIKLTMGGSMYQERNLMVRSDIWHKIRVIRGAHYDKEKVLKSILRATDPIDLVPVKYERSGEDTCFLVRNCPTALEKLCKSNLIITNEDGDPFVLIIILGFASINDIKVNIQPLLLKALKKRYDPNKRVLDLESFHKDSELSEIVHCPLSQSRTFTHLLKLAKSSISSFDYLNLKGNELSNLNGLETANLTCIKYLDLRNNLILNMSNLIPLQKIPIQHIWLDGNPVCENYHNSIQYLDNVRKYCPFLKKLDGVSTDGPNMPLIFESYFKEPSRKNLILQFVNHFFNLYDQTDRSVLKGLYDKNCFYSCSFGITGNLSQSKSFMPYTSSRNLLRKVRGPVVKSLQHIFCCDDKVFLGLKKLPRSYHERNSFICDVLYDDDEMLMFNVSGLFKSLGPEMCILSFSRTFVIKAYEDNEYKILNDQYHVDFPPPGTTNDSIEMKSMYEELNPTFFSKHEKEKLVSDLMDLSTMNYEWSLSFLEEANWDFRKALSNFLKDFKTKSVPAEAFHAVKQI